MQQFIEKTTTISATQMPDYGRGPSSELLALISKQGWRHGKNETIIIPTLEGEITASPLDWIIQDIQGEFYSCKPDTFKEIYELADNTAKQGFEFGVAIAQLKRGYRVARKGWNGKNMWIALTQSLVFDARYEKHGHAAKLLSDEFQADLPHDGTENVIKILPHIDMRTTDGSMVVGWLASQTDMLANDWYIVQCETTIK